MNNEQIKQLAQAYTIANFSDNIPIFGDDISDAFIAGYNASPKGAVWVEKINDRIKHLFKEENKALEELDKIPVGTAERVGKWALIRMLSDKRHELEEFRTANKDESTTTVYSKEPWIQKFQEAIDLLTPLVYYSQIHTVTGVCPVEFDTHDNVWRKAQKFIWDNCKIQEGLYMVKQELSTSTSYSKEQRFTIQDMYACYDAATTLYDEDLVKEAFDKWLKDYLITRKQQ